MASPSPDQAVTSTFTPVWISSVVPSPSVTVPLSRSIVDAPA